MNDYFNYSGIVIINAVVVALLIGVGNGVNDDAATRVS